MAFFAPAMRVSGCLLGGMRVFRSVGSRPGVEHIRRRIDNFLVAIEKSFVVEYSPSSLVLVSRTLGVVLGGHLD